MRYVKVLLATAALLAFVTALSAQDQGKKKGPGLAPLLHVSIADFADGGRIPNKYTCAAGGTSPSPAITWSSVPAGTQSFAVVMHDPEGILGGMATNDVLHWAIFDIPGDAKGLPEGVANSQLSDGSKQLNNLRGAIGYMGPCAPPGHGDHHYTFEIYALNSKLDLPPSTSRADLMTAMNGKVVAKGMYIGLFGQK